MEWKKGLMLCLDTETTGLTAGRDKILEVGAVLYREKKILRVESWLVNPEVPIPREASEVHGITDDDVRDKQSFVYVAPELLSLIAEAEVLVGYNWPFDAGFFKAEIGDNWAKAIMGKPIIDPLVVVRFDNIGRYWKGKGRHQLERVAARFGIKPEGDVHRASTDCILTLRVLEKVQGYLPDDGRNAARKIVVQRKRQDDDFKAWLARQRGA